MKAIVIKIYGKVQSVGFRYSAEREAKRLEIKASANNEPDGSVRIEAEGDDGNLEKFIAWCHKGPENARVERVEVTDQI